MRNSDVDQILESIKSLYYAREPAIRDAIKRRSSFKLIHLPTSFKVDVFVSRGRPFDLASFKRSGNRRLGTTDNWIEVPLASVEDILLAKFEWYRVGNKMSERQWDDVTRLVKLNIESVDWGDLEKTADELELRDLLDRLKISVA